MFLERWDRGSRCELIITATDPVASDLRTSAGECLVRLGRAHGAADQRGGSGTDPRGNGSFSFPSSLATTRFSWSWVTVPETL